MNFVAVDQQQQELPSSEGGDEFTPSRQDKLFQDFTKEAQTAAFFCLGLAGFGNQVPPTNQALDIFIKEYADSAFLHFYSYAMQLIETIRIWWAENGEIFLSADPPKTLRHGVELAYMFLGLKRLHSNNVDVTQLVNLLKNVATLPAEYLRQNIRTICGCILSPSPLLKVLNLTDLIENSFLFEYYSEEQLEKAGWNHVMNIDESWTTITMSEFLSAQTSTWIDRIQQEDANVPSSINREEFNQMWSDAKELQRKLSY